MPSDLTVPARVRASDELRQAALEQFAAVGFAGTSLQQIADHAGYAKSSVLYHYGSKEALLEAAVEPTLVELEALVAELAGGGRAAAAQASFAERFVDFLLGHRLAVYVFVNHAQAMQGLPIAERASTAIRALADEICADDAPVVEQMRFGVALAGAAYVLVAGATFLGEPLPDADEASVRDALVTVLLELLSPVSGR
ncbi:TetR/AcrR family transcriptional regulator [Agromyces protaetiae]|uniref:TetR/AcrR family transcriptional regulator n=1 Tax=Agromyces protaetiae TaxID=2509455 RepID=A0A4V0YH71_9MICO|nr:TetR/AcrR family transcriptional regulator [Agromyces protaetiae]QAY73691.1 TetR/AcrR family transcriptional regulator [Agromyces protaetiae]